MKLYLRKIFGIASFYLCSLPLVSIGAQAATLQGDINVDNAHTTYISADDSVAGTMVASGSSWPATDSFSGVVLTPGIPYFIHVDGIDAGGVAAFLGDFTLTGGGHMFAGGGTTATTDGSWQVSTTGWSGYVGATTYGTNGVGPWGFRGPPADPAAIWIWSSNNNADNEAFFSLAILPTPVDLSLVKTLDTVAPHYVGDTVQYTITVSNPSSETAADIQVTDTPSNLSISSVSSTNCAALPCTISSLAGGASEVITLLATIDAAGPFANSASVTSITGDPDSLNNASSNVGATATLEATAVPALPQGALGLLVLLTMLLGLQRPMRAG